MMNVTQASESYGSQARTAPTVALNPTLARLLDLCRMNRTWKRGEGVWLFDDDGRRFLDCWSQYGAVSLGHNAPPAVAALRAALDECQPAMVQPYRAPNAVALADALTKIAPAGLDRCVLVSTGAEAVEAAIKLARSRSKRSVILTADGSFHGKTMGALAATGQPQYSEGFGPRPPGFERVAFGDVHALAARLARSPDVAALLLEPIQGERGVHLAPPGYLRAARELCDRHGVLLVLDEIQTGLGRTGRLFACEDEGVSPDLLLLGKALGGGLLPLAAVLASAHSWDEHFALRHSSTFANSNLASRVGLAVLEQLTPDFCAEVARKGRYVSMRLEAMARRHPRVIAAVRGRGLLSAIELARGETGEGLFLSYLRHQGLYGFVVASTIAEVASVLVAPTLGDSNVLRFAPPLTITDSELRLALDGIESAVARLSTGSVPIVRALLAAEEAGVATARDVTTDRPAIAPSAGLHLRGRATYVFLAHYTCRKDILATDPRLAEMSAGEFERFSALAAQLPFGAVVRCPPIMSQTGAVAEGLILALPALPEQMRRMGRARVRDEIIRAVDQARSLGAQVVGLGAFTTPFSERGRDVVGRGVTITTGNALSAGMAFEATRRVVTHQGRSLRRSHVAVVGARGSVGSLCARLVAREQPSRLVLVGSALHAEALSNLARQLRETCEVEVSLDVKRVAACDVVVAATSAARPALTGVPIRSGTIICDVARPFDTPPEIRARGDVTVIDGGLVALPDRTARFGVGNLQGLPDGIQLACLSETILLALEGESRDHGVGDDPPLEHVDRVLDYARRHGFHLADPVEDQCEPARRAS
jgi:acetylornithine/succinyldiaminopimelate/putrescine aminotransferase/predicted amino acid dehydrogenase